MPTSSTINTAPALSAEFLIEFSREIGDAYVALKRGVGSDTTPGSALWNLAFLSDIAGGGLPRFGVIAETSRVPFAVTPITGDGRQVQVGGGQIAFLGQRIELPPQITPIYRPFAAAYPSDSIYGVQLGLPLADVQRATTQNATVVLADAASGSATLSVQDTTLATQLGFPLKAYLGATFVVFGGLDDTGTRLRVDYGFNGGQLPATVLKGTQVYFLYSPRVLALCGLPVSPSVLSSLSPADFPYYHPLPADWLPIAKLLVSNPAAPQISAAMGSPAILSTVETWQAATSGGGASLLSDEDAATVLRAVEQSKAAFSTIRDAAGVGDLIAALVSYTRSIANNPRVSFGQYWAAQPFRINSNFAVGVSFDSIERIEFSPAFARAYFDQTGKDVSHTFALFRGDLFQPGSGSPLVGSPPAGVTAQAFPAIGPLSSLSEGTYFYGVSALVPTGETPLSSYGIGKAQTGSGGGFFLSEIASAGVSSAQGYHVYRRSTLVGDQTEWRITPDGGIPRTAAYSPLSWSATATITPSSKHLAFPVDTTGKLFLGGISFLLQSASAPSVGETGTFTAQLYTDNGGVPGTLVATGSPIPYSVLKTTPQLVTSVFNTALSASASRYFVVLQQGGAAPPGGGYSVRGRTASPNGATLLQSNNASAWTAIGSGSEIWYKASAFLDYGQSGTALSRRGIRLTGRIALTPARLSVYVPLLDHSLPNLPPVPVDGTFDDQRTQNELVVTVIARKGAAGPPTALTTILPKGTLRGTRVALGLANSLFDRVDEVTVVPGSNLSLGADNAIIWSPYDFVTIETVP